MATELAKAYVQIIPSAEGIQGNIAGVLDKEAVAAGTSAGNKLSTAMGAALKAGGAIVAGAGAAIAGLTTALVSGAGKTAEYGDNIDKMSQKMGLSIEAYQEWDAIMQHSGTTIDSMQASMKTLATAAETNNKAFEALGISQEELANLSQEDLFATTITALQNVESETERTYLAGQLLGRGATELGALLNTSAEDTEAMRQRVHELGGVMSDDAVKAAAAYQDSLQDMQTAFSSLSRGLLSDFMPGITQVMDGLTEIFSGDSENGIAIVSQGVDTVISNITDKLPQFLEFGTEILKAIVRAIIENLPKILESGGEIVGELIAGLIKAIPELIKMAPEIVFAIIKGLASAWPDIRDAGLDIINELGGVISGAVDTARTWGKDLIDNFIQGIKDKFSALTDAVSNVAQTVANYIGFSEPELGPLSDFHTFAPDMMDLFAQGIKDNLSVIQQAVNEAAATTQSAMTVEPTAPAVQADNGSADIVETMLTCTAQIVNAIRSAGGEVDLDAVARALYQPMQRQSQIHGSSLVAFSR